MVRGGHGKRKCPGRCRKGEKRRGRLCSVWRHYSTCTQLFIKKGPLLSCEQTLAVPLRGVRDSTIVKRFKENEEFSFSKCRYNLGQCTRRKNPHHWPILYQVTHNARTFSRQQQNCLFLTTSGAVESPPPIPSPPLLRHSYLCT